VLVGVARFLTTSRYRFSASSGQQEVGAQLVMGESIEPPERGYDLKIGVFVNFVQTNGLFWSTLHAVLYSEQA